MKKQFWLITLLIMLFMVSNSTYAETTQPVRILVLSSYSRDFVHVSLVEEGIVDKLRTDYPEAIIRYEYLDSKNYKAAAYEKPMLDTFRAKYSDFNFDVVITVDNNALDFMMTYRDLYLSNKPPVIATGINGLADIVYANSKFLNDNDYYLIEELPNYKKSLELMKIQNPGVKRVYFILDQTATCQMIKGEIQREESEFPELEFIYLDTLSPSQISDKVQSLTSEDGLFFVLYFQSPVSQETYTHVQVLDEVTAISPVPVYGFWDFYITEGITGGYLLSSRSYGEKAADLAIRYLNHQEINHFNYENGDNIFYKFNYEELEQYDIKYYPAGSIILNKPTSFLEEHRDILIFFTLLTSVLIIVIILLMMAIRNKNKLNETHKAINLLNSEIIETQREFITTLGEVIENRSKETANHVLRVAKISGMLAHLYGLTPEEVRTIEMVSPLHDIGKIGIPDAILNKPGKLTKEEYELAKAHTVIGHNILKGSNREIMTKAGIIAYQHHEKWDGTGYPNGLAGEEIHISAQITCIADIYDALIHKRVYKEAWSEEEVLDYIKSESGKSFNPVLVRLFIEHYELINQIRKAHAD